MTSMHTENVENERIEAETNEDVRTVSVEQCRITNSCLVLSVRGRCIVLSIYLFEFVIHVWSVCTLLYSIQCIFEKLWETTEIERKRDHQRWFLN